MAIVRAPRPGGNFYILDKSISEDETLTWEARGVLIFLLGKPDHWTVSTQALVNQTEGTRKPSGRDSVRAILGELIQAGYAVRKRARDAAGHMAGFDYHVSEQKNSPAPDLPATAEPGPANTPQVSIEPKQEMIPSNNPPLTPQGGDLELAKADPVKDGAAAAFDHWRLVMDSPRSAYDDKRRRKLEAAVRSYGLQAVLDAITGCSLTAHNMGHNGNQTRYNGIDLIFRSADQVERFSATGRRGRRVGPWPGSAQPARGGFDPGQYSEENRQAAIAAAMAGLDGDLFSQPGARADDDGVVDV